MPYINEKSKYLRLMGITQWVRRANAPEVADLQASADAAVVSVVESNIPPHPQTAQRQHLPAKDLMSSATAAQGAGFEWQHLKSSVSTCRSCGLCETRTQTVFGVGNEQAEWLVVGEAPGVDEDRLGEPFVGRAGKLLDNMLFALGLRREDVYIANILKCRPPNNRDPLPEEVFHCEHFLKKQVALIRPKIILAVGRIAAQNLLKIDTPIGKMRGSRYVYEYPTFDEPGIGPSNTDETGQYTGGMVRVPLVVTYHPAYLLRSPREKSKSWQDLKYAQSIVLDQSKHRQTVDG